MKVSNVREKFKNLNIKSFVITEFCHKFYQLFNVFLAEQLDEKANIGINDFIDFLKKQPDGVLLQKQFEQYLLNVNYRNSLFHKYLKRWQMIDAVVLYDDASILVAQLTFPDGSILKYENCWPLSQIFFTIVDKEGKEERTISNKGTGIFMPGEELNLKILGIRKFAYITNKKRVFIFDGKRHKPIPMPELKPTDYYTVGNLVIGGACRISLPL